jgi:hypothetical protein
MPGLAMEALYGNGVVDESNGSYTPYKESFTQQGSPRSPLSPQSPQSDSIDLAIDGVIDTSIDPLYHNVCEMQSFDRSPSRASFVSYGWESRIDSELRHLVGYNEEFEVTKEVVIENKGRGNGGDLTPGSIGNMSAKKWLSRLHLDSGASAKSSPKSKSSHERPPIDKRYEKNSRKGNAVFAMKRQRNLALLGAKFQSGVDNPLVAALDNPDLGPFLLKQARDMISSGENPQRALELALRAMKSLEICAEEKPSLDLVMCLYVLAAMYCSLGQYNEANPVLERSIDIPVIEDGQDHSLAKFAGCMQLGDTYAMLGQIENCILFYTAGMEIQKQVLGETDPRLGETCRYVAKANVQALQLDEAEKLSDGS